MSLERSAVPSAAEADVSSGRVGCRALPRRDSVAPAVGVVTEVRAALLDPARALIRSTGISSPVALTKRRVKPVRRPLPDVAGHVVEAVGVGGNEVTGAIPSKPSAPVFRDGKSPCQTFIRCPPPGSSSSPHGYAFPSSPPRAAKLPLRLVRKPHARPRAVRIRVVPRDVDDGMIEPLRDRRMLPLGVPPIGALNLAPPRGLHDAFGGREVIRQQAGEDERPPNRSASVTSPVSSTKREYSAFETASAPIEKADTSTSLTGPSPSSGYAHRSSLPIVKTPPSSQHRDSLRCDRSLRTPPAAGAAPAGRSRARSRIRPRYCRAIAILRRSSGEIRWSRSSAASASSICTQPMVPVKRLPCTV